MTDELVRRFGAHQPDKLRITVITVIAVDPTRRRGGPLICEGAR